MTREVTSSILVGDTYQRRGDPPSLFGVVGYHIRFTITISDGLLFCVLLMLLCVCGIHHPDAPTLQADLLGTHIGHPHRRSSTELLGRHVSHGIGSECYRAPLGAAMSQRHGGAWCQRWRALRCITAAPPGDSEVNMAGLLVGEHLTRPNLLCAGWWLMAWRKCRTSTLARAEARCTSLQRGSGVGSSSHVLPWEHAAMWSPCCVYPLAFPTSCRKQPSSLVVWFAPLVLHYRQKRSAPMLGASD